jgi:hypothetical protein
VKLFSAAAIALAFSIRLSQSTLPAFEVTGDLDTEENRDGRSGNELTTGLTGCDGGIDERPREELNSISFTLLSPARLKFRGS